MRPAPKIVILTGSELRHTFFRTWLAASGGIGVARSCCEGLEKSLGSMVGQQNGGGSFRSMHLRAREQSEEDFFRLFIEHEQDRSNPVSLPKGAINEAGHVEAILAARPDLIVAYGCSIIRGRLLEEYRGRIINVHLGLSPYYRGSGTNYWPLVNGEPEFAGVTFMHMDAGVDTGEIIHQIAARIVLGDGPAHIGNRLIADMARVCRGLILRFGELPKMPQPERTAADRLYKKKDFTEDSVAELYRQFRSGLVEDFLRNESERRAKVKLVRNPAMEGALS